MFGNDDQVIEIASGTGGFDITEVVNSKSYVNPDFADLSFSEDDTQATVGFTSDHTLDLVKGSQSEVELMKVLLYNDVDENGDTVKIGRTDQYTGQNVYAKLRACDSILHIESSDQDNFESVNYLRLYVDNLDEAVNVENYTYEDFPTHNTDNNYYKIAAGFGLNRWRDDEPTRQKIATTSSNYNECIAYDARIKDTYALAVTITLINSNSDEFNTPTSTIDILSDTTVTYKKDIVYLEQFIR